MNVHYSIHLYMYISVYSYIKGKMVTFSLCIKKCFEYPILYSQGNTSPNQMKLSRRHSFFSIAVPNIPFQGPKIISDDGVAI